MPARRERLNDHFPLFSTEDYDVNLPHNPWRVGLKSTFPEDLTKRIIAATISFQMGYSGVDYTYKRHLAEATYESNDARLDIRIENTIIASSSHMSGLMREIAGLGNKTLGNVICELTMMRASHSLRQLLSIAHRGNLYEACAVARMVVEQLSWAASVDPLSDADAIRATQSTRTISSLKRKLPCVGRLYGWLSTHTHWDYMGHIKAMNFDHDGTSITLQSSHFKAISIAVCLLLVVLVVKLAKVIRPEAVSLIFNLKPDDTVGWHNRDKKERMSALEVMMAHLFEDVEVSTAGEINRLLQLSEPLALLDEVRSVVGSDNDIKMLCDMAMELAS